MPSISVVIPTYRRSELIRNLLQALVQQTLPARSFEVVVVDDCSDDGTSDRVRDLVPSLPFSVQLVRTERNGGPAVARNLGWRLARAPLIAFVDDDVSPMPGWLEAGLAALTARPEVGVMQGRTSLPPETDLTAVHYGPPNWDVVHLIDKPTPQFEACNIFYRRQALEGTGGFDEVLAWWGEDTVAAWRSLEAGWERAFAGEAEVTHPMARRGWAWFVRNGFDERNMVSVGARYPGFRREAFWRPWAFRREGAAFALAVAATVASVWFLPLLVLAAPYLWLRRPSVRHLSFFRLCVQIPVVDAARLFGHLRGSLANRVFVL
jgi:glycosyltransferase involved in cell wall biosynthesis